MISYAQNFEDVILWRALKDVPNGFYIDIGAQDPIIDSVSRAFYEAGWRGVHVEPSPFYAAKLRQERPDETVLEWAIGQAETQIPFFHFPDTGLSTGVAEIARGHEAAGFRMEEIAVAVKATAQLLNAYADRDIHWMKIDCEGMEPAIIEGWGASPVRPWIVLIESVLPTTRISSHEDWEPALLALGYDYVYSDELNRFYISHARNDLKKYFGPGPNFFDSFASAHFNLMFRNIEREIAAQRGVLAKVQAQIAAEEAVLDGQVQSQRASLAAVARQTAESVRLMKDFKSERAYVAKLYDARLKDKDALVAVERARATESERARESLQDQLGRAVAGAAEQVADLHRQLEGARAEVAYWRASATSWQSYSQALIASTSWWITKPIRVFRRALRRLLRPTPIGGAAVAANTPATAFNAPEPSEAPPPPPPALPPAGLRSLLDHDIHGPKSPVLDRAHDLFATFKATTSAASAVSHSEVP